MASRRQDIVTAIGSRLAQIKKVNGYQTDAGLTVFPGHVPGLGPDDVEVALAIVVGDDRIVARGEDTHVSLSLTIHAVVKVTDREQPTVDGEAVIADIKRAVEQPDRRLGGLLKHQGLVRGETSAAFREQGSGYTAGSVTYEAEFAEKWGAP